jgi:low temperature requirement protein LtrA
VTGTQTTRRETRTPGTRIGSDLEVTPLKLFFDLVFVFAVSQLWHHLLEDLSWRGPLETLVLPVAFSV